MKLNFGHGILVVILLFMAGISLLVYKCSLQRVDLVSPKYYEQELKYSEQMNKEKNTLALSENIRVSFHAQADQVVMKYPESLDASKISGEILFFKPDNNAFDFNIPVKSDPDHLQQISSSNMPRGLWKVKVNWKFGDVSYYSEEKIVVN